MLASYHIYGPKSVWPKIKLRLQSKHVTYYFTSHIGMQLHAPTLHWLSKHTQPVHSTAHELASRYRAATRVPSPRAPRTSRRGNASAHRSRWGAMKQVQVGDADPSVRSQQQPHVPHALHTAPRHLDRPELYSPSLPPACPQLAKPKRSWRLGALPCRRRTHDTATRTQNSHTHTMSHT